MDYQFDKKSRTSILAKKEIPRGQLVKTILNNRLRFTYIQAGAGYGKTTLLSQVAASAEKTVCLSLNEDKDIFSFVSLFSEAIKKTFSDFEFTVSKYYIFEEKENLLAEELIGCMKDIKDKFFLIFDDIHTIHNKSVRNLITNLLEYAPENIHIILSSREAPWKELMSFLIKGSFLELNQNTLAFSEKEAAQILGLGNENIYKITEGWPLAVISFKVLFDSGVSLSELPASDNETLYTYLFSECISRLPNEVVEFLKDTACFDELDAPSLDHILQRKNSGMILDNLVFRNLFTTKNNGYYRYHALFKKYLLGITEKSRYARLQKKAAELYLDRKDYQSAAVYAINIRDTDLLQKIILSCYKAYIRNGSFNELRLWFEALDASGIKPEKEILVAKSAYLSCIGNFTKAKACLDLVIPLLLEDNNELYMEAMLHKARVYRNYISFEESNRLLDDLIKTFVSPASEQAYDVFIEKLYNLCWNSQINDAYALAQKCIEACAREGNLKIRNWYRRYMSAICFFMGNMKEAVYYYEKSLELPENEQQYLDRHNIGIYAAKAYQMLGDRSRSLSLLTDELQKLNNTGKYEELWSGYLFAAEIYYQNTFIDSMNGKTVNYEATKQYFALANEYAPLYRKTEFQMQWVKMLRLTYSLAFSASGQEDNIKEIFQSLDKSSDYLKCIILARLFGYYALISDYPNAVRCASLCIEAGEKSNMKLHSTLAYGIIARAALASGDLQAAELTIKRYLQQCYELGIYEYFRMRKAYEPIVKFAFNKSIEPVATQFIMDFAGYKAKKAYIKTLGGFTVFPYGNRTAPIKLRTRKERELLAFLIHAGNDGVTKEQLYSSIWSESESNNIKKLIGVNLAQLKKDLAVLSLENAILCNEKHYSISMEEIECDFEQFEEAAARFELNPVREEAVCLVSLYSGEYLSDFEALWAVTKRIRYQSVYEKAAKTCL